MYNTFYTHTKTHIFPGVRVEETSICKLKNKPQKDDSSQSSEIGLLFHTLTISKIYPNKKKPKCTKTKVSCQ